MRIRYTATALTEIDEIFAYRDARILELLQLWSIVSKRRRLTR